MGLNHKQAPVEVREKVAFDEKEKVPFLKGLIVKKLVFGAVLVSTCNRVELYAEAPAGTPVQPVIDEILATKGLDGQQAKYFYNHRQTEAVGHLFRVACGLDSMILGEPQIFGQVKEAYFLAKDGCTVSTPLNLMFQKAFQVAKRVRTDTGIGERPVTVSYAAFNMASSIFDRLTDKRILIIGAGEMSRIVATHFVDFGVRGVTVANRTFHRAEEFASHFGATAIPWEGLQEALAATDIVISCTGAARPIIKSADIERAMAARRWEPMFIIDIAVPRDVEPEARDIDGVYLYDIDDLQRTADEGIEERRAKAAHAESLIEEEVDLYVRFVAHQELSAIISDVVSWAGSVQEAELQEAFRRMGDLDDRRREILRNTVRRVVHKILHSPITEVKKMVIEEQDGIAIEHFQKLFSLPRRGSADGGDTSEGA